MRHNIVEGEPGSLPWPQWQLLMWLKRVFSRHPDAPPPGPEPEAKE